MTTPRPPTDGTEVPVPVTDTDPRIPVVIEPTGMPPAEEYEDTVPGDDPDDPTAEAPTDPEIKPDVSAYPVARLDFVRGNTRQRRSRRHRRARRAFVRAYGTAQIKMVCAVWRPAQPLVITQATDL